MVFRGICRSVVSTYISKGLQRQICDRFGSCCAYCQTAEALTAMTFEFEHIVPLSAGGETIFTNLCFACPTCNRCKGDRAKVNLVSPNYINRIVAKHQVNGQDWKLFSLTLSNQEAIEWIAVIVRE